MPGDGHFLDRPQAATPERRSQEKFRDARRAVGTLLQLRAQLREARDEPPRHPLVGEQIAARGGLIQKGLQRVGDRQLRPVVVRLAPAGGGAPPRRPRPANRWQEANRGTQSEHEAPGTGRLRGTAGASPRAGHGAVVQDEADVAIHDHAVPAPALPAQAHLDGGGRRLAPARRARAGRSATGSRPPSGPRGPAGGRRR